MEPSRMVSQDALRWCFLVSPPPSPLPCPQPRPNYRFSVSFLLCYDGNGTEHTAFDEVSHFQALSSLQISLVWTTLLFILFGFVLF